MKKTVILLILLLPVCSLIAQNESTIDRDGHGNEVTVDQFADVNWSDVDVTGHGNGPSFVTQSGLGLNMSDADQIGHGNNFDVTQVNSNIHPGDVNNSYVYQEGNGNDAVVNQLIVASTEYPNADGTLNAYINQYGNGGHSEVIQEGLRLNATVNQYGRGNSSYQVQGASQFVEGAAFVNDAYITQWKGADGNSAYQHQVGLQNVADITQEWGADDGVAIQLQVSGNVQLSGPEIQDNNVALIKQHSGDDNYAVQLQYYQGTGVPNYAYTHQHGSRNSSVVVQIGENNSNIVNDHGNGNDSNVWQDNYATRPPIMTPLPIDWPAGYPN